MTAASVTIDAGVLAVPVQNGTEHDAHRYVETLLCWSKLLDEPWFAIYMSERASEVLSNDGLFPLHDQLRRLFRENGIEQYSVNDVTRVVNDLLQRTPHFETYFLIQDVLAEDPSTEPDILRLCAGTYLQSDLARCVVLIAILRHHCQRSVSDHLLILRRAPGRVIRVRALVQILIHERDDLGGLPELPSLIEGDVLACDDFKGLTECLDDASILLKAADDVGIDTAVRIAVFKARLARAGDADWDDAPAFRIGRTFLASVQNCNPTHQLSGNLLHAIIDTLEGANMAQTHALRTGAGGENPQRVRRSDNAKAWRRDIDSEHHLHYWVCEEGLVELASMSFPHDDFSIPE